MPTEAFSKPSDALQISFSLLFWLKFFSSWSKRKKRKKQSTKFLPFWSHCLPIRTFYRKIISAKKANELSKLDRLQRKGRCGWTLGIKERE